MKEYNNKPAAQNRCNLLGIKQGINTVLSNAKMFHKSFHLHKSAVTIG